MTPSAPTSRTPPPTSIAAIRRAFPETWKNFIPSVDAYIPPFKDDSGAKVEPLTAWANVAAKVEYSLDNLEDARSRFDTMLKSWPSSLEAPEAAYFYVQTFMARKEDA